MPCYSPLQAYRLKKLLSSGKRSIVFSPPKFGSPEPLNLPCGRCIGCRLERSRQWAVRCVHEASLYDDNCFITLTYNNENLPKDGSLNMKHFQDFMKRLRKKYGEGIRFFHCGEYGERYRRPHYHAILFNHDFSDKVLWKEENGQRLYRSKSLEKLWTFGHSSVGSATFESAAYVARYIMKKINGPLSEDHYQGRKPEYTTMSRRPGIGKAWYDIYQVEKNNVYPRDEVIMRRRSMKPPKYYDSLYEISNPDAMEVIKVRRQEVASSKEHAKERSFARLNVRRKCKEAQIKSLVRNVDKDDL